MDGEKTICVMCAWRATCNKKFSRAGGTTVPCPEYTKDVLLTKKEDDTERA